MIYLLIILLFLTGCTFIKDAPELTAGQCYTHDQYSEFGRIVIKKVPSKYSSANAYLVLSYDRVNKDYYFYFRKQELFDPVYTEKCPYVESIAKDAVKKLKAYGLWEEFKTIVQKIEQ